MANDSYFRIDENKINGLRRIADEINFNELMSVIAMFGLRATQECNIDMIQCGEMSYNESPNTVEGMKENAMAMMIDMINDADLASIMRVNDFGDYTLKPIKMEFRADI